MKDTKIIDEESLKKTKVEDLLDILDLSIEAEVLLSELLEKVE